MNLNSTLMQIGAVTVPRHMDDGTSRFLKGVNYLSENEINKMPNKYILPVHDQPGTVIEVESNPMKINLRLPMIDMAELRGPNRSVTIKIIANACEEYKFFQVINHEILTEVVQSMIDVSTRFFEQPHEERAKYMSSDMFSPVRYGTSLNQNKDEIFYWRHFLKLAWHPMSVILPYWPSFPTDLRYGKLGATYAWEAKSLFKMLTEAILEGLGLNPTLETTKTKDQREKDRDENVMKKLKDGSQLVVINCYPPCPEPHLTLGMPPHSDYGFLTVLLHDGVEGLQIQFKERWLAVEPIPSAFVVHVGDHLEIFSNGRYKSVLYWVLANSVKSRVSVASLPSLPHRCTISPLPEVINEANPQRYKETDFASFLEHASSCEPKRKNCLESRKLA